MNDEEKDVSNGEGDPTISSIGNSSLGDPHSESDEERQARLAQEEKERIQRIEGLKKEERDLLTRISEKRAERRSLSSTDGSAADADRTKTVVSEQNDTVGAAIAAASEKRAIREFIKVHPEYADDTKWQTLISTYVPRRGKHLWEDIVDDLTDAYVLTNRDRIEQDVADKARAETAKKMLAVDKADIGGTSTSAQKPAPRVLTDPEKKLLEKFKKVDKSMTEEKFLKRKESLK